MSKKFKPYIGTKSVLAVAMNRQNYVDYRGWQLPEDEDGNDEGYLIEYIDGGKPNDERHKGYISWSPKDVFEKSYHTPKDRVTKDQIEGLLGKVEIHTTTSQVPTPHVIAIAWLGTFHLGTAISKAANPDNFNEEIGIQYSTKDVLAIAENKLWELEGYKLYNS